MSPRHVALYLGGFLGPFGTTLVVPMFPELRTHFDASQGAVGLGFHLSLVPFAITLLVSGSIGERFGRKRTVQAAYVVYGLASLLAAIAPSLATFVISRALMGTANAFITPLLVAGLAEMVPAARFGRELGIYSSFQAAGAGLGPFVGGLAADSNWTYAFYGTAVVAAALAVLPPNGEPRPGADAPPIKSLLTAPTVGLGLSFFLLACGPVGLAALVGVAARDALDLGGTAAGFVLLGGAAGAFVAGPYLGKLLDRFGMSRVAVPAMVVAALAAGAVGLSRSGWALGVAFAASAITAALAVVIFQALGATILPGNRGGALSFLLSFRFLGHAAGPFLLIPLVEDSMTTAFVLAAAFGLAGSVMLAVVLGMRSAAHQT